MLSEKIPDGIMVSLIAWCTDPYLIVWLELRHSRRNRSRKILRGVPCDMQTRANEREACCGEEGYIVYLFLALTNPTNTLKLRSRSPLRSDSALNLHCSLSHPSLVSVLSVFTSCDARYQVMDLCLHGNLHQILSARESPVLSEDELRGVLRGLADALVYLQKEMIVHRDVNPASILMDGQYRVVRALLYRHTVHVNFCI